MKGGKAASGVMVWAEGTARPPAEPAIRRRRKAEGRRIGATLPTDIYVRFKAYVASRGITGEQAILGAIEQMIGES